MSGGNLTRIKNNQITDGTILANTKIAAGSIVGSLFNANLTMTSDVTITGNLTVQGSSTYLTVASTNTYVNDPLIVLNNAFSGTNTYDIGLLINRGDQTTTALIWKESNKQFELTYTSDTGTSYGAINNSGYANLKVGNLTVAGVTTLADIDAGNITLTGDLAVNGGDITTTASTFNLVNATATTVNFAGAATTLIVGATTGVANIRNATTNIIGIATVGGTLGVTGDTTLTADLAVNGGDLTTSASTFNLVNANATTLNLAGAATTIAVGATTGTLTINNPTVVGTQTTQNLYNTTATTVNAFGAATTLIVGATTGVANIRNATTNIIGNATVGGTLGVTGHVTLEGVTSTGATGTGLLVFSSSPALTSPNIGTPSYANLSSATDLPVSTGISGLAAGVATFLATPNSSNLISAVTDETGTGNLVFSSSPALTSPNIGTPSYANLSSATDLPVSTGISGLAAGVATFLATPSSSNLISAVTDETGTGALVFGTSPTVTTSLIAGGSSFDLLNTTATTVNFAGVATTLIVGATTGIANIRNATTNVLGNATVGGTLGVTGAVTLTDDLAVNGGDLTTSASTFNLVNANATTLNLAGAATTIAVGANSGTITIGNPTLVGTQTTQAVYNTTATTVNAFGAATTLIVGATTGVANIRNATTNIIGNATVGGTLGLTGDVTLAGDLAVNGGDLTTSASIFNLIDATATTVNFAGEATTIDLGATSGTLTINNPTVVGTQTTQNLYNTTATTMNFAGAATALNVGAATGNTTVQNNLITTGNAKVSATTESSTSASGALIVLGGVGIAKNLNVDGNVVITGDLTVNGNVTTLNTATLDVEDLNITVAKGAADSAAANGAGLTVDGASATILYTHATTSWNLNKHLIGTSAQFGTTLGVTGDTTLTADLAVNGGDLTTSASTFNLVNATATTLNLAGAATTIAVGANSGTITIGNPTLVGTQTTQAVYNTTATTVNAFGAATTLIVGATTGVANIRNATTNIIGNATVGGTLGVTGDSTLTGNLAVNGGDITTTASTFNLANTNATTVDAFKAATDLEIGATSGTLTINNPTVVGTQTTQAVFNTTATTVNAFGAATTMILGATTGIANIRNATTNIIGNATVGGTLGITGDVTLTGDLAVNGGDLTTTASTATVFNTNATTVNAFGAATTLGIGAGTGNLTLNNATITTPGQIISTRAGSATTGNGQLFLNGSTSNRIDWADVGTGAPAFTTRTAGTKVVLYPALGGSTVDYAIGIDAATMWSSVPENDSSFNFKWYGAETLVANLSGTGNFTTVGDVAVNGGDLTTTAGTFNLVNANATTVNAFGAATTLIVGAATGVANIRNATTNIIGNATVGGTLGVTGSATLSSTLGVTGAVTLTDDLAVNGGDITTSATTFNLVNATATTLNLAGAATTIAVGATTGTLTINNPTVVGTQTTQAVFNTTATTVNFAGAATTLIVGAATGVANIRNATTNIIGNATVGGTLGVTGAVTLTDDLAVNGGDITTTSATATVFNTNATTVDAFKAATDLEFGATTGTLTINNPTVVGTQTTQAVFNTTATTVDAFGAATTMILGATTGTANIRNATTNVLGNATVAKGTTINSSQSAENFVVKGASTTSLIVADSTYGAVIVGGSNATPQLGSTFKVNGVDTMLIPVGTTAQRPSNSGNVDVGGMMRFNSTINNMEFYDGSQWQTAGSIFTVISDRQFSAASGNPYGNVDGTNVTFTVQASSTTAAAIVSINGVLQMPAIAYDISADVLTFTEAPALGDIIDVRLLATTTTVAALTSANGLNQFIANNTEAQIWTGTSSTTKRFFIDVNGNATFNHDVTIVGNLTVNGDSNGTINIGDASSDNVVINASSVTYTNGTKIAYDQTAVTVGTSAVVIDSFAKATYRSAKYIVNISNSGTGEYETTEVLVIHNGTTATRTQYATMFTGAAALGTVSVAVNGANVELSYTGAAIGNAVKLSVSYIKV